MPPRSSAARANDRAKGRGGGGVRAPTCGSTRGRWRIQKLEATTWSAASLGATTSITEGGTASGYALYTGGTIDVGTSAPPVIELDARACSRRPSAAPRR